MRKGTRRDLRARAGFFFVASALFAASFAAALPDPAPTPTAAAEPVSETTEVEAEAAPVFFDGVRLFTVEGIGGAPASERAAAIEARLRTAARNAEPDNVPVQIRNADQFTEILFGKQLVMLVLDVDARAAGMSRLDLARDRAPRIGDAIRRYRADRRPGRLLRSSLVAVVATLLLTGLIWLLGRSSAWLITLLRTRHREGAGVPGGAIGRFLLRFIPFVSTLLRFARVLIVALLAVTWLEIVLSAFPGTRAVGRQIRGWIRTPLAAVAQAFVAFLPDLFYLVVIAGVGYLVTRLVRIFFLEIEQGAITIGGFHREWAMPTFKLARLAIIAFAAVMAFPHIPGSSTPAFQGISIFLGLIVSLSSSSAIGNMMAGVVLTYTRAFNTGDRVRIADTYGDVVERTLLVTRVRTIKNVVVTIPNAIVLGSHIDNYSTLAAENGLILHTTITIGYDAPWRRVHELLIEAARATDGIRKEPPPFVRQTSLNDFHVSYEINACAVEPRGMDRIYSDLHQNIQEKFNEAGIEIMSPGYTAVRDGNTVTIPPERRPRGYEAPGFRVEAPATKGRT
jgi:small-conductance mechanosensitive channel